MPPTETFPGHQLTCLRIIHVLKRMKPKVPSRKMKNTNADNLPLWTISRWNSLPTLARTVSISVKVSAARGRRFSS